MNRGLATAFFIGTAGILLIGPAPLAAQVCQDEDTMVQSSRQTLIDLVSTIKKESLQDFESKFHRKSSLSNLNFSSGLVGDLVDCLDKVGQDATATPDQKTAAKTKREAAAKLKDKLDHGRDELKSAANSKDAKAILEKLNLAD